MDGNFDDVLDEASSTFGVPKLPRKTKSVPTSQPAKVAGYTSLTKTTGDKKIDSLYEKFGQEHDVDPNLLWAQGHQESGFRNNATSNKGARGVAQFMPATAAEFGVDVNDPASSINGQARLMRKLLDRTGDVELSLAGYNSGHNYGIEQLRKNRRNIAETREYVDRITQNYAGSGRNKFSGAKNYSDAPDYTDLLNEANSTFGGQSESPDIPDYSDLLNEAGNAFGDPSPVKESDFTINEQIKSAADANSPRAAVLLTDPSQFANLPSEQRDSFTPANTANGNLLVSNAKAAKLGLKNPTDIFKYVEKNGFAQLIGKVEDVGNQTSDGITLRTEKDGKELTSSVVSPQNIETQKQVDLAAHPNATNQEVLPTQDAVTKREAETIGGVKQPLILTDESGKRFMQTGDQSGLQANQVRVRDTSNDKGGITIATKSVGPDGKESYQIGAIDSQPSSGDDNFKAWLDYKNKFEKANLSDSPEARAQFQKDLATNENFGSDVAVNAKTNAPSQLNQPTNTPVSNQKQTQNGRTVAIEQSNQQQAYAPGTPENLAKQSLGIVNVDLSQKPAGESATDYANRVAIKQIDSTITDEEISAYFRTVPQRTAYDDLTAEQLRKETAVPVTVRQGTIDEIKIRRPEVAAEKESLRTDVQNSLAEEDRVKSAQTDLEEENRRLYSPTAWESVKGAAGYALNPISGVIDSGKRLYNQIENNGQTPEVSEGEIYQEAQRRKDLELSPEAEQRALDVGERNKGNFGTRLLSAAYGGVGRTMQAAAGIVRPFDSLGIGEPYKWLSKTGSEMRFVGQTTNGDSWEGTAADLIGGTPIDLLRMSAFSELPGGQMIGLSLDHASQSAGRGDKWREIQKEGTKGAAIGALFPTASVLGKSVAASPLIQTAVKLGTVGVGSGAIEFAGGTPLDQSVKAGIQNALFELLPIAKEKLLNTASRFWSKGVSHDVIIDETGNMSLVKYKSGENPNRVDFEMVLDPTDGVYKESAEVGVNKNKQIGRGAVAEEFDANQAGNVPSNDVANYNRTATANLETSQTPRELAAENPRRIEVAQSEAVQKAAVDTRAQKVAENLKGKTAVSIEDLQKATRYNKGNVEDAVMLLYAAKQVEILPDNSVRFIGNETASPSKSLFDRAAEVETPKEPIKLQRSALENETPSSDSEISSSDSHRNSNNLQEHSNNLLDQPAQNSVEKTYTDLPQQKLQEAETEKPKAKVDYAARPNLAEQLNVFTERGTKAAIEPKVVDSTDLLTSLDENYPPEFQPRDRSRAASKAQISEIAGKLNPEFLGDSPKASDGRPLVAPVKMPDGQTKYAVISGNGRTEGIREAYNLGNENSQKYADFAKSKGASDAKQPVYVGVLNPNEIKDLPNFAKEANESATAQMSATERAKSDAERLPPDLMNKFVASDDGTIHGAANRDFVRDFVETVPSTERGTLQMPDGSLSQEGVARVRNAIFARAFGDSEAGLTAIQRMSESTDNNVKNITNGLLAKAGQLATLREAAKSGARYKEFDIASDLAKSMEKYASLKDSGGTVEEYIQQGNLFGAETTPFQTRVMQVFDAHKRSPKAIRSILDNYLAAVEAVGNPNQQNLFGRNDKPSVESVFEGAVKSYEQNTDVKPDQVGLFNQNQGREIESGARQESDADASQARQAESRRTAESRQNRLENRPAYSLPVDIKSREDGTKLNRKLTVLAKSNDAPEELLKQAKIIDRGDGAIYTNPEATEIVRRAHRAAFDNENLGAFFGSYLNPRHVEAVAAVLQKNLGAMSDHDDRRRANAFLRDFNSAIDKKHGDLVQISTSYDAPGGLPEAVAEERAHRADFRVGLAHSIGRQVVQNNPDGLAAMANLRRGAYRQAHDGSTAMEVIAKTFVPDETETGLNQKQKKALQLEYLENVLDNGATAEQIEQEFSSINEIGKEFSDYAKQREKERKLQRNAGNQESSDSAAIPQLSFERQGDERAGQRSRIESDRYFGRQSANLGRGFLEPFGEANQSLMPRDSSAPLYKKPTSEELDPDNIEAETESAVRTIVSYIYDGKRDVSPTEAAMNILRTGYLAGLSVVKTNVVGNTSNIVFEQLAKPLMATADILNPKAKQRTTPGLSLRDIYHGFVGKGGFFRGGFVGDQGVITALLKGVDEQESSRVDMNVADKKSSFVRNTGVPLIDVIIEATKRVVTGVDRPFKAFARTSEKSGLARLEASKDKRGIANALRNAAGLDADWKRKMTDLRDDPSRLIADVAERYAEVVTFQNPNAVTQTYDKFRRFLIDEKAQSRIIPGATERKIAKYVGSAAYLGTGQIAPFLSTPSNVGFRTLEYFAPTGIAAAAFKFYRIGQSLERQSFVENEGGRRAKIVKRLAAVRGNQDKAFNQETDAKTARLANQKKARIKEFEQLIEDTKNSKVFTDKFKQERIADIKTARSKWLDGWTSNRDKYVAERQRLSEKAVAERRVVDGVQKGDWESEDAYADLKFSEFENRAFAEAAGRAGFGATVGSLMLLGVIYGIIKAVGTTDYTDEKEKSKQKRAAGIPDNSISIFGYRFPYAYNPFGNAFKMSLNLFEQFERPGKPLDRASAMAERFGKDVTSLNPLTSNEFTKNDWASWAGSKANSMTPLLNLKILQEIGEVLDEKPRKYWEEGFAAQYLIKLPWLREYLPASDSALGGDAERGDIWRRAARAVDPLQVTKENKPQSALPVTPATKNPSNKIKKFADTDRRGFVYEDIDPRFELPVDPGWNYGSITDDIINDVGAREDAKIRPDNPFNDYRQSYNVEDRRRGSIYDRAKNLSVAEIDEKLQSLTPEATDYEQQAATMKRATDAADIAEIFDNAEYSQGRLLPLIEKKLNQAKNPKDKAILQKSIEIYQAARRNNKIVASPYDSDEVIELQRIRDEKYRKR